MIDIGCGGGILSESLAGLGAKVTAIDPTFASIECARNHMETVRPELKERLQYIQSPVEDLDQNLLSNIIYYIRYKRKIIYILLKLIYNMQYIYNIDYKKK